jgi:hypothetical protein
VRANEANVDKEERGVLDLRDDAISISLDIKNDPIVCQEVSASKRCAQITRASPVCPFDHGEPQPKETFGILMFRPEGDKRDTVEDAQRRNS